MQQALTANPQFSPLAGAPAAFNSGGMLPADNAPVTLRDLVRIASRYRVMIIATVLLVTIPVLAQQLLSPKIYQSTTHVQVELIDAVGLNQADVASLNSQRVTNAVRLHRSRTSAARVLDDLDLINDPDFRKEVRDLSGTRDEVRQRATNTLLSMIEVTSEPKSDLLQVSVSSRSPTLSAQIANQLPESVGAVRIAIITERRKKLLGALEQELELRRKAAIESSERVAQFRRDNRMLVGAGGIEDLSQLNQIAAAAANASSARAGSAARASGVAAAANYSSTATATSAVLDQLERQRAQLIADRSRMAPTFGPNHPEMVKVTSQLAEVDANIRIERSQARANAAEMNAAEAGRMTGLAQSEMARDAAAAGRLSGIAASIESKAFENVANSVRLAELVRASELSDKAYQSIAERLEQVRAQMQPEGVSSSVVSPAVPSFDPISPSPVKTTLFAILASLMLGFMLAYIRELLDDRLRTAAQVSRHFNLPTFGMLPLIPREALLEDPNHSPVILDPQSLFAEVARSAYSDVRGLQQGSGCQVVLITSPLPGDGKSTVSLALAAAGAALGDRTIVLDLDLRKRGLLQQLQESIPTADLIDLIAGKIELDTLIPRHVPKDAGDDEIGQVLVLSTNRKVDHPNSMISSRRLIKLVGALRERFDLVVINAPAVLAVRDARTMCDYADHTIMVARWGRTTSEQMRAALQLVSYQTSAVIFDHVDFAEHARRRYGDSIQFYMASSDYYTLPPTAQPGSGFLGRRRGAMFGGVPRAA